MPFTAEDVRAWLTAARVTQSKLSRDAGVSPVKLSRFLNGRAIRWDPGERERIAEELRRPVAKPGAVARAAPGTDAEALAFAQAATLAVLRALADIVHSDDASAGARIRAGQILIAYGLGRPLPLDKPPKPPDQHDDVAFLRLMTQLVERAEAAAAPARVPVPAAAPASPPPTPAPKPEIADASAGGPQPG